MCCLNNTSQAKIKKKILASFNSQSNSVLDIHSMVKALKLPTFIILFTSFLAMTGAEIAPFIAAFASALELAMFTAKRADTLFTDIIIPVVVIITKVTITIFAFCYGKVFLLEAFTIHHIMLVR